MRIGELARRTGVSERSLRYYEARGLLKADRTPGGHREYPDGAVDRVIRIQEFYAAGLRSSKIGELLPCVRDSDGGPAATATPRLVSDLGAERDRIDRMISDLQRSRDVLDDVIATAKEQSPSAGSGDAVA
ncbi:MerR family transcriptional regulator [Streptomyces sp. NBC_00247]|uniref:MerR family transcriptional regulator n=1 Tax=Streptomyces sp. NBC_00247 TaxID=2975689 RepID=UPI002E2B183D|nr:MerR family transcriptional regulator [Streptomyces sp. NBC_00247]